ncbi:MAG: hypothetical protein J6A28_00295 [Clostridia bacterium]|nr:hypothetical protein [Clostridia bacterium]
MKKKVVYLIGIILLCMLVWGATYLGLRYCEENFGKGNNQTSAIEKVDALSCQDSAADTENTLVFFLF